MTDVNTLPNGMAPLPEVTVGGRPYRIGSKDGKLAQAWQWIWNHLSETEWSEGRELAERAAARFGLKQSSLLTHLSRMASAGVLEVDYRFMPIRVSRQQHGKAVSFDSRQKCAFFRIKR